MSLPAWWSGAFAELERLAIRLETWQQTLNTAARLRGEISAAKAVAEATLQDPASGRRYRRMRLRNIPVPPPVLVGVHPSRAQISGAETSLLYECWEDIKGHERFGTESLDRIRRAGMQVRVTGSVTYGQCSVTLEDHWRVDTHHFPEPSTEPHPWIHYQRGGHAQDAFSTATGFLPGSCLSGALFEQEVLLAGLMQTPAPRIATPPLDPVCGIDFVLAQHSGVLWASLWSNADYAGLIQRAQARLWEPWFMALGDRQRRRHLMPFYGAPKPVGI